MKYLKVQWLHDFPDEPIWLFSELDDQLHETRKVEIFRDGSLGFADVNEFAGGSMLSDMAIPFIDEIAADPQFVPQEIPQQEFEAMWMRRREQIRT